MLSPLVWSSALDDFAAALDVDIVNLYQASSAIGRTRRVAAEVLIKRCCYREYLNQDFAWKHLNGKELRVPRPVRYIWHEDAMSGDVGYMIMEYIHGRLWCDENDAACDSAVASAIATMHSIDPRALLPEPKPGPIDGQQASWFPWGDKDCGMQFTSSDHLSDCVNKRLRVHARRKQAKRHKSQTSLSANPEPLLDFSMDALRICHLDLAPRNILICTDGRIALLDWEMMSLYPIVFELAALSLRQISEGSPRQNFLLTTLLSSWCSTHEIADDKSQNMDDRIEKLMVVNEVSIAYHF